MQQYEGPLRARRNTTQASLNISESIWPMAVAGRLFRRPSEISSWMGLGLVFITLFLSGFVLLRTLLPNVTLVGFALSSTAATPAVPGATPNPLIGSSNASQLLVRLSQLDPAQITRPRNTISGPTPPVDCCHDRGNQSYGQHTA